MFTYIHRTGKNRSHAILMLSLFAVSSCCPVFADDPNIAANNTDDNVGKLPEGNRASKDSLPEMLARKIKQQIRGNVRWSTRDGETFLAVDLRTANDERLKGLQAIVGDLAHITRIDLSRSQISDSALSYLCSFTSLQSLKLNETQIGDSGLEHLKGLTSLKTLNLNQTHITDKGLRHLVGLRNLREMHLFVTDISDEGLRHVGALPNLEHLGLTQTRISDAGLKHLADLKKLKILRLGFTNVTDAGLIQIGQMHNLQVLDVYGTNVTDKGLEHLTELNHLEALNYYTTNITRAAHDRLFSIYQNRREELIKQEYEKSRKLELPVIAKLKKLGARIVNDENGLAKELILDGTDATDEDLHDIRSLTNLVSVRLSNTKITNAAVAILGDSSKLQQLALDGTQVSGSGLASLKALRNLYSLSLKSTLVNDSDLKHLELLPTLQFLDLGNTQISDQGLEILRTKTTLTYLSLANTNVTDDGLNYLKEMSNLTSLDLSGTKVTDDGLNSLIGLSQLIALGIGQTPATNDEVVHFENLASGNISSRQSIIAPRKPNDIWTRCDHKVVSGALLLTEGFEMLAVNAKRRLAVGYRSADRKQLHLIELDTGVSLARLPHQANRVHLAEFSGDGEVLAIYGNVIRMWKLGKTLEEIAVFKPGEDNPPDVHWSKRILLSDDGNRVARLRDDGAVMINDRDIREPIRIQEQLRAADRVSRRLIAVAMSPDGKQLAFSLQLYHKREHTSVVSLWDVDTQQNTHRIVVNKTTNHLDGQWPVDEIEYSHDGSLVAFWRRSIHAPKVVLCNSATGEIVVRLKETRGQHLKQDDWNQCRCAFSPDDKLFIASQSGGLPNSARTVNQVWSASSGKLLSTFISGGLTDHVFAENGVVTSVGRHGGHPLRLNADPNRSRTTSVIDWNLPAVIEAGKKHLAIAHFSGEMFGIKRGDATD